jgi:hypothetical protein
MDRIIKTATLFMAVFFICPALAQPPMKLTVSGAVTNAFSLECRQLALFNTIKVQSNEITSNKEYNGAFVYSGVSLQTLLDAAKIEKKDTDFNKGVDLAVLVKNADGKQIALSWGEIYYKNPQHVMIAISAEPIFPRKGIDHFEDPAAYHAMIGTLNRKIDFPKLVVTGDFHSDRCMEKITDIIVHDLRPRVPGEKSPHPYSEKFSVTGDESDSRTYEKLPELSPRVGFSFHVLGEGRGFHGTHTFSGIPLREIIQVASPSPGLNSVFLVSAPDAYRALVSYGELFLSTYGERIILADQSDGAPIKKDGKFILVLPDDLMADRMVKAVCKIEAINLGAGEKSGH